MQTLKVTSHKCKKIFSDFPVVGSLHADSLNVEIPMSEIFAHHPITIKGNRFSFWWLRDYKMLSQTTDILKNLEQQHQIKSTSMKKYHMVSHTTSAFSIHSYINVKSLFLKYFLALICSCVKLEITATIVNPRWIELLSLLKEQSSNFLQPPSKCLIRLIRLSITWKLSRFSQETVLAVTHIDHCCHLPAVHRCGRSLAAPSWSRKFLNYVSPWQSECSPDCSRTYIEHIHLNETGHMHNPSTSTYNNH